MQATPPADPKTVVIGFARQLAGVQDHASAVEAATARGWLDATGEATAEGLDLAASFADQSDTRTAFRNI